MIGRVTGPLAGIRVIEASSFVAGPSAGLALSQLGADVIRVDPPTGGSDAGRWPLSRTGASLFWTNLNRGKRSVTIDHRTEEGLELLLGLVTAPGPGTGILVDNMVGRSRIRHEQLIARRADAIHVHIEGRRGGLPAVDYSINAEVGVPMMTGPSDRIGPVNHVLPAWDLVTGMIAATSVAAAVVHRDRTGRGSKVDVALSDVALAGVAEMGWLAEAHESGSARERLGNHMFGTFGVDFETSDGRRVMVVALTTGQWHALQRATGTESIFTALAQTFGADLDDEGARYRFRDTIESILRPWFATRDFANVEKSLDAARVLWSPYRDMSEVVKIALEDSTGIVHQIEQPGVGTMLSAAAPWRWGDVHAKSCAAPDLSAHTDEILGDALGLSNAELAGLRVRGVVG
ncbi:2-methylfumaryl-CoA isomerase [Rhodococcus sp. 15-725-2-2b]|nr:2-methylfumaryl-CoA isomerase [Rhodococcus sp. 06-470-2]OZC64555.1 2-methylfumaryl-CoA isomerase [Rhodococcus sp. 06-469-3-2]OZD51189.1 2-methylfumaryl-CoA isomerase [Rhodococcus sp. 06-1477-1A]OZE32115.1 2-methylfumaryl-CoA isomerase [Rhodococcus sp. 05-2254-5]OZE58076.1 2-methylfumaryl-CoA isomerase [Rhodococcus sp. 05-2221-1B]OZE59538.1 2-methylfumaryl-CoA isomerase [Rhodococcus sp. 05-2254-1]OZE71628.1 2-methylfumaryl-CoA isomerase [Rhodococcus sp. 15-725-2-2b]